VSFVLGQRSLGNLASVHPLLVSVVQDAIKLTGVDFGVPEQAARTLAEQEQKVAQGVSKTLHSMHLIQPDGYGHAVDLVPWINGAFTWQFSEPFYAIALAMRQASLEASAVITWGAVWDRRLGTLGDDVATLKAAVTGYCSRHPGPDFLDLPHFQLEMEPS
jgi:peptidoglycan L-alanyl-D-glutamate endopeptidase CwlK